MIQLKENRIEADIQVIEIFLSLYELRRTLTIFEMCMPENGILMHYLINLFINLSYI